jgi:hypothetical protein
VKTYYCHESFKPGITCLARTEDGRCVHGWPCGCEHRSVTPKYVGTTPPMPKVKSPKRKSTDCTWCKHKDVCRMKKKFNELKKNNYPLVCECEKYEGYNPLLEV